MPWFAKITSFKQHNNVWEIGVDYYNSDNPSVIVPRQVSLPLTTTKSQAVQAITERGQEVRKVASINSENLVGTVIQIP
jgi:hypothetical protein